MPFLKQLKHVTSRRSAISFFTAYDALCEDGTATPVSTVLDEIADVSVPGGYL